MRPEYVALEHAHIGAVAGWADVSRFVPYRSITLHRFDTDGAPLVVRAKSVRRAIRRVEELDPGELGLSTEDADAIIAGNLTMELSDDLIQIAAIGRAVYEREGLASEASSVVKSDYAGQQARSQEGKTP